MQNRRSIDLIYQSCFNSVRQIHTCNFDTDDYNLQLNLKNMLKVYNNYYTCVYKFCAIYNWAWFATPNRKEGCTWNNGLSFLFSYEYYYTLNWSLVWFIAHQL